MADQGGQRGADDEDENFEENPRSRGAKPMYRKGPLKTDPKKLKEYNERVKERLRKLRNEQAKRGEGEEAESEQFASRRSDRRGGTPEYGSQQSSRRSARSEDERREQANEVRRIAHERMRQQQERARERREQQEMVRRRRGRPVIPVRPVIPDEQKQDSSEGGASPDPDAPVGFVPPSRFTIDWARVDYYIKEMMPRLIRGFLTSEKIAEEAMNAAGDVKDTQKTFWDYGSVMKSVAEDLIFFFFNILGGHETGLRAELLKDFTRFVKQYTFDGYNRFERFPGGRVVFFRDPADLPRPPPVRKDLPLPRAYPPPAPPPGRDVPASAGDGGYGAYEARVRDYERRGVRRPAIRRRDAEWSDDSLERPDEHFRGRGGAEPEIFQEEPQDDLVRPGPPRPRKPPPPLPRGNDESEIIAMDDYEPPRPRKPPPPLPRGNDESEIIAMDDYEPPRPDKPFPPPPRRNTDSASKKGPVHAPRSDSPFDKKQDHDQAELLPRAGPSRAQQAFDILRRGGEGFFKKARDLVPDPAERARRRAGYGKLRAPVLREEQVLRDRANKRLDSLGYKNEAQGDPAPSQVEY